MEERTEGQRGRRRPRQKFMDWMMEDRTETQRKGTTMEGVELIDIWTCQLLAYLLYCTSHRKKLQYYGSPI